MGGEVMGLGSAILSTECDFPTGRIIQDWHRAFHTSTVSKKGIKLWAVQSWSSPRAGADLGAPFPPRFWPVRLGRVVGCCLGSTPPPGTSPVCGCWKAGTCTFPCHDFQIFPSLHRQSSTAFRTTRVFKTAFAAPPDLFGCGGECGNS